MLKANVNDNQEFEITQNKEGEILLNDSVFENDIIETKPGSFHLISDSKSYNIEVVKADHEAKEYVINVNGKDIPLTLEDKYDLLLKRLGLDMGVGAKLSELKAPMPGMVLDILVSPGDEVKKGDGLIVLEAMKMENVIKSPDDLTIKSIEAEKSKAVDKNQIMITFE